MTEATLILRQMAERMAPVYAALPGAQAVMLTGSAATGDANFFSDLDMTVYYKVSLPSDDQLDAARRALHGGERFWRLGERGDGAFAEAYNLNGIECQIGHTTLAAWQADMDAVLVRHNPDTPLQKSLSGILDCIPLHGEQFVAAWKARAAAYPDALAEAMVNHHLRFFPLWSLHGRLGERDALLWMHQSRVETLYNILGVLAGLNRLYFSTFQFKRMGLFVGKMRLAPPNLAPRLTRALEAPVQEAALLLRELVVNTVALIETAMPQADMTQPRRALARQEQPWQP